MDRLYIGLNNFCNLLATKLLIILLRPSAGCGSGRDKKSQQRGYCQSLWELRVQVRLATGFLIWQYNRVESKIDRLREQPENMTANELR